jgi:hypothetical protein
MVSWHRVEFWGQLPCTKEYRRLIVVIPGLGIGCHRKSYDTQLLKESLSAVRRALSADLQGTGALAFKCSPLPLLKAWTRKVVSVAMGLAFPVQNTAFSGPAQDDRLPVLLRSKKWFGPIDYAPNTRQ